MAKMEVNLFFENLRKRYQVHFEYILKVKMAF